MMPGRTMFTFGAVTGAVVGKDIRTGMRDRIVTYMLLAPVTLGLLMAILSPLLQPAPIRVAVASGAASSELAALAARLKVVQLADREEIEARVLRRDDVVGLIASDADAGQQRWHLIVQGNEDPAVVDAVSRAVTAAWALEITAPSVHEMSGAQSIEAAEVPPVPLRLMIIALMLYSIAVVAGIAVGFTILEEKTTNAIAAMAVSPMHYWQYLLGKLGLGSLLAMAMVLTTAALCLGRDVAVLGMTWTTLAAAPSALTMGLVVAAYSKDQLTAIAMMKGLLPIWTSLPIAGFVLSADWMWTMWPFANHWAVQGYAAVLVSAAGGGDLGAMLASASDKWLLAFACGLPPFVLTLWWLKRRLGL